MGGGSDYSISGSRGGNDAVSTITWLENCGVNITAYVKANQLILAVNLTSAAHAPDSESFKLQWKNTTDAGSFADVTTSGE